MEILGKEIKEKVRNIVWSYGFYNNEDEFILSERALDRRGNQIPDGEHVVEIESASWNHIDNIPPQDGVENSVEEQFPDFTQQTIIGKFNVKNGFLNAQEIDDLFPSDWRNYNTHIFFECLEEGNGCYRAFMGS